MQRARYVRLYADELGVTHFEDLEIELAPRNFVAHTPPLNLAPFMDVSESYWIGAPGDWDGETSHPTPQRQIYCTVSGEYEVTAGDGEVRCFPAGSILLLEDTTGEGHQTRITYNRGVLIFAVAIAEPLDGSRAV